VQEAETVQVERLVVAGLKRIRWREADLNTRRKGVLGKVELAWQLRLQTTIMELAAKYISVMVASAQSVPVVDINVFVKADCVIERSLVAVGPVIRRTLGGLCGHAAQPTQAQ
jgi:hypothetical protein